MVFHDKTLSELASRMICVRSNITQLMGRLEADGLVQREEDPHDRRCVRATLTPLGRERQREILFERGDLRDADLHLLGVLFV